MFIRRIFYILIFLTLLISVLGYGTYKALPLILGPKIELRTPENGTIVDGTTVMLRGTVERSQKLFINGVATGFTKDGLFETSVAVYPGNNILTLVAYDRFNRPTFLTLTIGTK